jgi:hypothetical protein
MTDPDLPTDPSPAPAFDPTPPETQPDLPGEPDPAPAYDPPEPDTVS